jgi:hypothetical protein
MNLQAFRNSINNDQPIEGMSPLLQALWHDAKGNWDRAHELAQSDNGPDGCWVHAYLHRVEGDISNAGYWYRRADKPACNSSLKDEWAEIASALADPS